MPKVKLLKKNNKNVVRMVNPPELTRPHLLDAASKAFKIQNPTLYFDSGEEITDSSLSSVATRYTIASPTLNILCEDPNEVAKQIRDDANAASSSSPMSNSTAYVVDYSDKARGGGVSNVTLSKRLSFLLRHGAKKLGIRMRPDGLVLVSDILRHDNFSAYEVQDIIDVVVYNEKKRFAFLEEDGKLYVRANQGHSLEVQSLELHLIGSPNSAKIVVHGTYKKKWDIIKDQGLNKMGRNHIHFAAGLPGENGIISGMRTDCDVLIYIDVPKAFQDGIKFYRSSNNVILSAGIDGVIPPQYFKKVESIPDSRILFSN